MLIARRDMVDLSQYVPRRAFVPLHDLYIALAIIGTASSALAIAQTHGWYPFYVVGPWTTPGLFYNPTHTGAALALIIVALWANKLYWFVPALLPGMYLAHSRGGWAALAVGIAANYIRQPLLYLIVALALGIYMSLHPNSSDLERLQIWDAALGNLTLWGNGLDSFMRMFIGRTATTLGHPEYVHNDWLQTVYEIGVWSLIPFAAMFYALSRTRATDWPTLVTFSFLACFTMPMHMPIPFALGAIALATTLYGDT